MNRHINIQNLTVGNDLPFTLIAGPCQIESRDHALDMAGAIHGLLACNTTPSLKAAPWLRIPYSWDLLRRRWGRVG